MQKTSSGMKITNFYLSQKFSPTKIDLNTYNVVTKLKYFGILRVSVAEWSKALVLGTRRFGCVGSSPTSGILLFFD